MIQNLLKLTGGLPGPQLQTYMHTYIWTLTQWHIWVTILLLVLHLQPYALKDYINIEIVMPFNKLEQVAEPSTPAELNMTVHDCSPNVKMHN